MIENLISPTHVILAFLTVAVIAFFSFAAVASWSNARRLEREAYYKADVLKKIAESAGAGANAALQMYREEQHASDAKKRERLRVGGFVLVAVGIGLYVSLRSVAGDAMALFGMLPLFVGVALASSSFVIARR